MSRTNSPQDKLLLAKAYDAIELSERRSSPRFVGFLNEHEAAFLRANLPHGREDCFFGGYPDAIRVMFGAGAAQDDYPITALAFTHRPEFTLSHRDYLGALTALGIRRETIGDILVDTGRAVVFFADEIVPFVLANVDKVGRVGVRVEYADPADLPLPDEGEERMLTLSSLRLDAFVAAACCLSREKAAQLIRTDMVTLDHAPACDTARTLCEGACVTVRGYGKYILSAMLGTSRKGKLRIAIRYFGK